MFGTNCCCCPPGSQYATDMKNCNLIYWTMSIFQNTFTVSTKVEFPPIVLNVRSKLEQDLSVSGNVNISKATSKHVLVDPLLCLLGRVPDSFRAGRNYPNSSNVGKKNYYVKVGWIRTSLHFYMEVNTPCFCFDKLGYYAEDRTEFSAKMKETTRGSGTEH